MQGRMPTVTPREGEISDLSFHPLIPDRWADFEKLFGKRGACGGCWCMWWRLPRAEFMRQRGEENRKALKRLVDSGKIPGILAYLQDQPVGWCAVAPRETFSSLERSRILRRVDDRHVWSIVCFFVAKPFRNKGISARLLNAAVQYVRKQGGEIVEGYPNDPKKSPKPDPFVFTGLVSAFRKAGFTEVVRRSETRPIMRYVIGREKRETRLTL